jgi:hypothetical protein
LEDVLEAHKYQEELLYLEALLIWPFYGCLSGAYGQV